MSDNTQFPTTISLDQWKRIFTLAEQVRQLQPWKWMTEEDLFGVEDPATGGWGVVSIMGEMGEHLAVTVLRGAEGFYGYINYMYGESPNPLQLLQVPMTQLVFGQKRDLIDEQLALIKQLKLKPKGKNAWIYVDDYRPGFLPAFAVSPSDANLLEAALSQLLEVAPRVKQDETLLYPSENANETDEIPEEDTATNTLFWRVPHKSVETSEVTWKDEIREVPFPALPQVNVVFDIRQLETIQKLPKYKTALEFDIAILPTPMEADSERPYFPFIMLAVDARTQQVVFNEIIRPLPSLQAMYEGFTITVLSKFIEMGKLPTKLHIRSPLTVHLIQKLTSVLKIKVEQLDRLPGYEAAMINLLQFVVEDDLAMDEDMFDIDMDDLSFLDGGDFDIFPPKPK